MPTLLAFDFSNHQVILRSLGLLSVLVLFLSFAYLEYAGLKKIRHKWALYCLIAVSFAGLLYVLVTLKGA